MTVEILTPLNACLGLYPFVGGLFLLHERRIATLEAQHRINHPGQEGH